jgi:predicted negative regulator of RcsB-dependent stress response
MENVMSTGVESWSAESIAKMDALYPFVGSEVLLTIIAVVVWIGWHIWQIMAENAGYDEQVAKLQGNLPKAVSGD